MFNIGFGEMLIIGVIVLLFFDPRELPELSRKLGKIFGDLKRASNEVTSHFNDVTDLTKKRIMEQREEIRSQVDLKEIADSINKDTDEFLNQVKKELDELEELEKNTKPDKGSV